MQVIPAIDIRGGRCARLFKGDYAQETVFDNDPVDAALRWVDMGAQRLHVIDLDGAKDGQRINAETVARIARSVDVPIQMGGGIRSVDDADAVFQIGVNMVIFGTTAVEDPDAVQASVQEFGEERVCVSVDAEDGVVRTRGWLNETSLLALDLLVEMSERREVRNFIYTDTARDGTLSHPNFDAVSAVVNGIEYPVMVAGGIATVEDVVRLCDIGAAGAITGMAIYTGSLNLADAIESVQKSSNQSANQR
ncbi:MAG: 1-(5-phosphoribosyl)-5-[(5-phosphoribosylamino)methylideneamino]imidazole-4-carboxamide isomerase [Chloroflexi bacterium]|nr:1-(5-phosphoribosyl)-5-[(5-phosphoribosylamino)methylideneamino]imidazole-4-carboxamide isomerase [Chloroflexota bacterium]